MEFAITYQNFVPWNQACYLENGGFKFSNFEKLKI